MGQRPGEFAWMQNLEGKPSCVAVWLQVCKESLLFHSDSDSDLAQLVAIMSSRSSQDGSSSASSIISAFSCSLGSTVSSGMLPVIQSILQSDDMNDIKGRLHLMCQRIAAAGPPVPTAAFPFPPENQGCKCCRRKWRETRNPARGDGKSPFLTPARVGSLVCTTCRNVKSWAFNAWEQRDLENKCKDDDEFHAKYFLVVLIYEDKTTDPKHASIKVAGDMPQTLQQAIEIVQIRKGIAIKGSLMIGVVWPVEVYKAWIKEDPHKDKVKT